MPRVRGNDRYVTAGVRMVPNQSVQIRGNVYLPCGEVCERVHGDVFCAQDSGMNTRKKKHYVLNMKASICLLAILALIFGCIIIGKAVKKGNLRSEITAVSTNLESLREQNLLKVREVMEAKDTSKICYRAVHDYGMVNRVGRENVYIMLDGHGGYTAQRGVNSYGLQASNK